MKFREISDEIKEILEDLIEETGLFHVINFIYYGVDKQREVVKVSKLGMLGEVVSEKPSTIVISVEEDTFLKLSPEQQRMIAEDAIAQISFDYEKDKIKIDAPTINMTSGCWMKYGEELTRAYQLCHELKNKKETEM